ncbi:VCBS repeat-containing protein [Solwaraspora sp. WMMD1047]|uniref:FG-GAP repeat domain-containing protein n=1 Tax=Solwaraspora sp. WMMD1047 TaxID=3016102 RepID=UPI00241624E5|nr:VCBS repeat-containing protein [Solwaraspora sp. WMMD1047]MDG4829010.1 VCBS repeat-containing protein [Solwaraspora sp. WMMD1047]
MWTRRTALICAVVLGAAGLVGPAPAAARVGAESISGDITGDGIADRISLLGFFDLCTIEVEPGLPAGGYGPSVRHDYRPPAPWRPGDGCPWAVVLVDLGADRRPELVLADHPYDRLLIVRGFRVVSTYRGGFDGPGELGLADFDGDGRPDLYVGAENGFSTHLNPRGNRLVAGPMRFCSTPPEVALTDLDGDGRTDAVLSYLGTCLEDTEAGIVVVLDHGRTVQLRSEAELELLPIAEIRDDNGDGHPDVDTLIEESGIRVLFHGGGDGTFRPSPPRVITNHDVAYVHRALPTPVVIRTNDYASERAVLTITFPPSYGRVFLDGRKELVYLRTVRHGEPDRFGYRLTEPDGGTDRATVTVIVADPR